MFPRGAGLHRRLDAGTLNLYIKAVHILWEKKMPTETTYTNARANFANLCDDVASTRDAVIIHRRGAADVALVAADELKSLLETAHLLRSPKNADRLLRALARAKGRRHRPESVAKLRRELGLEKTG